MKVVKKECRIFRGIPLIDMREKIVDEVHFWSMDSIFWKSPFVICFMKKEKGSDPYAELDIAFSPPKNYKTSSIYIFLPVVPPKILKTNVIENLDFLFLAPPKSFEILPFYHEKIIIFLHVGPKNFHLT